MEATDTVWGGVRNKSLDKQKTNAEQGYSHEVEIDISIYFDTLNHELLMNLLRQSHPRQAPHRSD
ncbi:hypothetical protein FHR92_003693 [Fontibacillus solani]|uniref:Uncharacterized protein n=1 Tax=Fontibacillus solani TaxID=1572857 RepID=A0A7W3SVV2_9BACL|nr:hypothetical protein [Fontibacillus solani]MBA9087211.1 hypothetical protein [Fontibacillus solani]